jgi:hypothetical protein
MKNQFNIGISGCARCDGNHENLVAKSFTKPVFDDERRVVATHFAMCPTTEEPILVLSVQKAK